MDSIFACVGWETLQMGIVHWSTKITSQQFPWEQLTVNWFIQINQLGRFENTKMILEGLEDFCRILTPVHSSHIHFKQPMT